MNRRDASKQATRNIILAAARQLFKQKGPDRCTLRDIARAAGVSAASVVVHFKNKTTLMEVALVEDIERRIRRTVATLPQEGALLDQLMHVADSMYHFYSGDRELYRVLIRDTAFEPATASPHLADQLERYMTFFAGLIEGGKAAGGIKPDADARIAAASLFALYLSVLMELLRTPEMAVDAALKRLERMARQHLSGIVTEASCSNWR